MIEGTMSVIGGLAMFFAYFGITYLKRKTDNQAFRAALNVTEIAIISIVSGLANKADALRDENGKISTSHAKALNNEAMAQFKSVINDKIQSVLSKQIDLDVFIHGHIEKTVKQLKG